MKRFIHVIRFKFFLIFIFSALFLCGGIAHIKAQSDQQRQTVAITYPLDQTVEVKFRGTTLLPRLKGEAKIKRQGRRNTRVELSVDNLPRASELGGAYTTYVLWAISPEGTVDNLGEIKRSGIGIVSSKIDVTTPQQTFALILTAEPHFLVRTPSRMVLLENLPPQQTGAVEVKTANIQYLGNSADYIRNVNLPEIPDDIYKKTPTSLLGARVAVKLAAYAGAERYAENEFKDAQEKLQEAEGAWRLKEVEAGIDATARTATSLAVHAEDTAIARKAAEERREEAARRDADIKRAETAATKAGKESDELRAELARERRARELSERDVANLNRQVVDLRTEVSRLREELDQSLAESEKAKIGLARIEGERNAEQRRIELKQTLARFGNVTETEHGASITLPESIWTSTRSAQLKPSASATLEPLAALLANNPEYRVTINSYTDNSGSSVSLLQLTQARAQILAEKFTSAGIDSSRIQATGMGGANPIASNKTAAGKARNRRVEISLISFGTATASSSTFSNSN